MAVNFLGNKVDNSLASVQKDSNKAMRVQASMSDFNSILAAQKLPHDAPRREDGKTSVYVQTIERTRDEAKPDNKEPAKQQIDSNSEGVADTAPVTTTTKAREQNPLTADIKPQQQEEQSEAIIKEQPENNQTSVSKIDTDVADITEDLKEIDMNVSAVQERNVQISLTQQQITTLQVNKDEVGPELTPIQQSELKDINVTIQQDEYKAQNKTQQPQAQVTPNKAQDEEDTDINCKDPEIQETLAQNDKSTLKPHTVEEFSVGKMGADVADITEDLEETDIDLSAAEERNMPQSAPSMIDIAKAELKGGEYLIADKAGSKKDSNLSFEMTKVEAALENKDVNYSVGSIKNDRNDSSLQMQQALDEEVTARDNKKIDEVDPEVKFDNLVSMGTNRTLKATEPSESSAVKAPSPAHQQITVAIHKAVEQGKTSISLNLYPEALGAIEVKIEFAAGQSGQVQSIKITAERTEALDLLIREAFILEKSLNEVVKADGASLSFNLKDGSGQQNFTDGSEQPRTQFREVDTGERYKVNVTLDDITITDQTVNIKV